MTDPLPPAVGDEPALELRRSFHQQLDALREEIAALAAGVTESIPRATEVLLNGDLEQAEYLILSDEDVDRRCFDAEERCYTLLARQAPVAGDLRQIVAALRIIADIERSADLTVNICRAARRIYTHRLDPRLRGIIQKMGDQARLLFREATEAYLNSDASRGAALHDMDSYLDGLQNEFVQAIFESHSTSAIDLQVGVQLALLARFYERIGDHAVNIGERIRYLVSGWPTADAAGAEFVTRPAASDVN